MLIIKEITVNGVKSYFKEATMAFQSGTTVILGPNGAGKSTLLECIKYALFGEFMDQKQKIGDFINDANNFEIEMLFGYDQQDYLVRREVKLTGTSHNRSKSKDEITLPNGEVIPNKRDVDLKIRNDILGITSKVMDTATFVRQGSLQDIIGLQGARLRKEFSEILQLNRFEELKSVWNTMKIRYGREIDGLENKHHKYMIDVESTTAKEEGLTNLQMELETLAKQYGQLEKERLKLNATKTEKDQLHIQDKAIKKKITGVEETLSQKNEELNQLSRQLHIAEAKQIDQNLIDTLTMKQDTIEQKRMVLGQFYQQSQEFQSQIRLVQNQMTDHQTKLDTASSELIKIKNEVENLDIKISSNTEEGILNLENAIEKLNTERIQIADHFVKFQELRQKDAEIKTLNEQISHTKENFSKFEELKLSELAEITRSDPTAARKIVDNVFTILDDLRDEVELEKKSIDEIQINLQKLELELHQKEEIISELEMKGEHECDTCYSMITTERIDETLTRVRKFLTANKGKAIDARDQIAGHQNRISTLKPTLEIYEQFNQIHNVNPLLKLITKRIDLLDELTKTNLSRKQILAQNNLESTSEQKLSIRTKEISSQIDQMSKIIDTLKQKMKSEDDIKKSLEQLQKLNNGLKQVYETNHIDPEKTLDQINSEITNLKGELNHINQDITTSKLIIQLIGLIETLDLELENKNKEQMQIETKLSEKRYHDIDRNWDDISDALEKTRGVQSVKQVEVGSLKMEIANLKKLEEKAEKIHEKITKIQKMEHVAKEMEQIFAKIHPEILQQKTKNIEYRTNEMLNEFPSDSGIFNIEIDSKFNLNIRRRNSAKSLSTYTLSGGEKMSAAFALRVAMSKELADIGFMVLDEPTDGLDQERRKLLAEIIANQRHVKQLFVVTHDDAFNGRTDNTILVKQSNGSTQLIRGTQPERLSSNEDDQFDEY